MFKRIKPVFEHCSNIRHPEYQSRNTSVSEYLRKFGTGKISNLPTDSRPEVTDERSDDEMLSDESRVDEMAFDELDAISELNRKMSDFEKARELIKENEADCKDFDDAMNVLNSANSSASEKQEAMELLDEMVRDGKLKRTRARKK